MTFGARSRIGRQQGTVQHRNDTQQFGTVQRADQMSWIGILGTVLGEGGQKLQRCQKKSARRRNIVNGTPYSQTTSGQLFHDAQTYRETKIKKKNYNKKTTTNILYNIQSEFFIFSNFNDNTQTTLKTYCLWCFKGYTLKSINH